MWQLVVLPNGFIIGLWGPFSGHNNDKSLYNQLKLRKLFYNKKYAIMEDSGYQGMHEQQRKPRNQERPPSITRVKAYLPIKKKRTDRLNEGEEQLTEEERAYYTRLSKVRVVVENSIAKIKRWSFACSPFRHYHQGNKHSSEEFVGQVVRVIAYLANRQIRETTLRKNVKFVLKRK